MPTTLLWKSLDLYSKLNSHLSRCPVNWDSQKQALVYNGKIKNVFWWYFNLIVLTATMSALPLFAVLFLQLYNPKENVTGVHIIMWIIILIIGLLTSGIALAIVFQGEISVVTCNQAFAYHHQFSEETTTDLHSKSNKSRRFNMISSNLQSWGLPLWLSEELKSMLSSGKVDYLGLCIMTLIIAATAFMPLCVIVAMYWGFDPWKFLLEDLLSSEIWEMWSTQVLYNCIAVALLFIVLSEAIRLLPMLLVLLVLPVLSYLDGIRLMVLYQRKCNGIKDFLHLHNLYVQQQVININAARYVAIQAFLLTVIGAILSCGVNFLALKLYAVLPLPMYVMVLIGNAACNVIINMILPYAINIHENSKTALISWRSKFSPKSTYVRKKFGALRPLGFWGGINGYNFYLYERSVKSEYFAMILNNTINLLLSVPSSVIDSIKF